MAREVDRLAPVARTLYPITRPHPGDHSPPPHRSRHGTDAARRDALEAAGHPSAVPRPDAPAVPRQRPWSPRRPRARFGTLALTLPLAALAVAGGGDPPTAAAGPGGAQVTYRGPVPGEVHVVHQFAAPAQPWASGHRGVDLALDEGAAVLAPAGGTVAVAGRVVDRGVVTVVHPDGRRSSLEPVAPTVVVGERVATGDQLGVLSGERSHCVPACLHWGVREGAEYVDPLSLLPGGGPVVLLPEGG